MALRLLCCLYTVYNAVRNLVLVVGHVGQYQGHDEKGRGEAGGDVAEHVATSARAEHGAGNAGAEGSTRIGTLALLQHDEPDQDDRDKYKDDNERGVEH